jgi:hypothetical protein
VFENRVLRRIFGPKRMEHKTERVFENSEFRMIFGPKREKDGSWRKLCNDELRVKWRAFVSTIMYFRVP